MLVKFGDSKGELPGATGDKEPNLSGVGVGGGGDTGDVPEYWREGSVVEMGRTGLNLDGFGIAGTLMVLLIGVIAVEVRGVGGVDFEIGLNLLVRGGPLGAEGADDGAVI